MDKKNTERFRETIEKIKENEYETQAVASL